LATGKTVTISVTLKEETVKNDNTHDLFGKLDSLPENEREFIQSALSDFDSFPYSIVVLARFVCFIMGLIILMDESNEQSHHSNDRARPI